jgi:hypothetical protein
MEDLSLTEVLNKINKYESHSKTSSVQNMEVDVQDSGLEAQLDELISQLQIRIQTHQEELEAVS